MTLLLMLLLDLGTPSRPPAVRFAFARERTRTVWVRHEVTGVMFPLTETIRLTGRK